MEAPSHVQLETHATHLAPNLDSLKRKRTPENDVHGHATPPPKTAKTATQNAHLQINYLARQQKDDLPLVSNEDTLPNILTLISEYVGVLDRHESLACNLGARPLGPILIARFERLFDGPPKILKNHGKGDTTVSWLDVVEFAKSKPEQFQLAQMAEGVRVCQFYTKQCRVQISEEDYVLVKSGIPAGMIPPQPIVEDEEKELGTLEILEKALNSVSHLADQVAARSRQLNHRIKGRKTAILDRRASDAPAFRAASPSNVALMNGTAPANNASLTNFAQAAQASQSQAGFVAVNSHKTAPDGASAATRNELMSKFFTLAQRNGGEGQSQNIRRPSVSASTPPARPVYTAPTTTYTGTNTGTNTGMQSSFQPPSQRHTPPSTAAPKNADDGGPYKTEMVSRMDALPKGARVLPPCDRCRRLHMDCIKNLTACLGCTKKHAKCSWREVRAEELLGFPPVGGANGSGNGNPGFEAQNGQQEYLTQGMGPGFEDDEFRRQIQEGGGEGRARVATMVPTDNAVAMSHAHATPGGEGMEFAGSEQQSPVPSPRIHTYPPVPVTGEGA